MGIKKVFIFLASLLTFSFLTNATVSAYDSSQYVGNDGYFHCQTYFNDEGDYETSSFWAVDPTKIGICSWQQSAQSANHCIHCYDNIIESFYPTESFQWYGSCGNNVCGCYVACACTTRLCPVPIAPDKFRTLPQDVNGDSVNCAVSTCSPPTHDCAPSYFNAPPSCSFLPSSISMTREDAPKQIQMITTDADYGDDVHVSDVKVVDTAGNLKSCIKATVLGGGDLLGATVKNGSDNSANTSQTTSVILDPREVHGVFENVAGQSVCSGFLDVKIQDADLDGAGLDSSSESTCRIAVSVTNEAPQLSDVSLYDQDQIDKVRDMGDSGNGDLIDGRSTLFVGSVLTTESKSRAYVCDESLTITDPIKCPGGAEVYDKSYSQRRNPLQLEFTVNDANGKADIMQAGIWIQRVSQNENSVALPPVNTDSHIRNSFQALYSEQENMQVATGGSSWNFVSRACLGDSCGPKSIDTSSKQIFSALALITGLGQTIESNGNVLQGKLQSSTQKNWQKAGFPDCLNSTSGCLGTNIPAQAKLGATAGVGTLSNYAWAIAADKDHLICFSIDSAVPSVISASTPVICPTDCAACAKKEGVVAVAGNPNALTFKFGIYFNDSDGGQGMPEGQYSIFLSALDKVSAPLGNVTGKGDDGWTKFTKDGTLCNGATCPNGSAFSLLYDPVAPTVTNVTWTSTTENAVANISISDESGGSGIAGVTNRFMARQMTLDGEPTDDREWAKDGITSSASPMDGKQDHKKLSTTDNKIELTGYGLASGEEVVTGTCVYDRAGNMGCGRNGLEYVFLAPWIKTSYGDVYSSRSTSAPFAQTLPNNDAKISDFTKKVVDPFEEQIFTISTGVLMTNGSQIGVSGGYVPNLNTPTSNLQLGFLSNYHSQASKYNIFGYAPTLPGNEYERLRATANLNCDLLNTTDSGKCQASGSLNSTSIGLAEYNILYSPGGTYTENILCKNVNLIFVTGALVITGQVTKEPTLPNSGCIFVLAKNGSLTIKDTPSNTRKYATTPPALNEYGSPTVDRFEASVIGDAGALFTTLNGKQKGIKYTDRLEINGFIYLANNAPAFGRDLAPGDNKRFPAEWVKYDAQTLDGFRQLLGIEKTVDLTCGTSSHVLCNSK